MPAPDRPEAKSPEMATTQRGMPHRELDRDTHQARSARTTATGRARAQRRQSQGDQAGRHVVLVFGGGAIRRGDVGQGRRGCALVGTFRWSWPICPLEKLSGRRRATDGEGKPRGKGRVAPFPLSATE